jgi:serine/threonine protein phosphatase PrpC
METMSPDLFQNDAISRTPSVAFPSSSTVEGNVDHFILRPCVWAGGGSDCGRYHPENQDSLAIAAGTDPQVRRVAVVAVSDGVSTSTFSAEAAAIAAREATIYLADLLQDSLELDVDLERGIAEAFQRANATIMASSGAGVTGTWACTLVVAVLWRGRVIVGNIGDSRCYWLPDNGAARLLSTDDSLAQTRIDLGATRREAESGAQAHAILKWLGPGADDCVPSLQELRPECSGRLVVCSDGLWNYASSPTDMCAVVAACQTDNAPAWQLAERMTSWANDRGGRDNISIGVVDVPSGVR